MMKLKTIATTCLAVSGLALAQENTGSYPLSSSSSTGSNTAVTAPRTGLYTGVTKSNAAADRTVPGPAHAGLAGLFHELGLLEPAATGPRPGGGGPQRVQ